MRALLQRVCDGAVEIESVRCADICHGLVIFFGAGIGDTEEDALYLARKTANLRIFSDDEGKMNLSVLDVQGEVLVVSQFTLYADTRRGNRPSFSQAAPPDLADKLYELYVQALRDLQVKVKTGVFQADMQVSLTNDGPVTILLESK